MLSILRKLVGLLIFFRFAITALGQTATQLVLTTQPVGGASGSVLATQPVIAIRDASGNTVTTDSSTQVTLAIQSGTGGTLGGTLTRTAASGVATFSGVTLTGTVGQNYVLRFTSSPTLTLVDSSNVTVTSAAPTVSDSGGTRTADEDVPIAISGVTVGDVDSGSLTVTVTAVSGTITLASTTGLSSLTGDGTNSIQFTATIANANTALAGMTFTPTLNFSGAATFNGSANDGTTTTALGLRTITFTAVNDAPVGVADAASLTEDETTVSGNVLTNDTDPDSVDTKTVSALTGGTLGVARFGSYGYLMLSANGDFTYTLDGNLNAVQALVSGGSLTETFTYTVADAIGLTASTTLTVAITGANDRPSLVTSVVTSTVIRTQSENITTAFLVSELLLDTQNASIGVDPDTSTQLGVAITTATSSDTFTSMAGAWSYSLNSGTTWMPFPVVSGTSALLLPPAAQVRFAVTESTSIDSRNSGHVTFTYKAWDQSGAFTSCR